MATFWVGALGACLMVPYRGEGAPILDGDIGTDWDVSGVYVFADEAGDVTGVSDSGYDILATHFYYDSTPDVLYVAIDTDGIAGDADGDGNPGNWGGANPAPNDVDPADYGFGGGQGITVYESFGVAFDMNRDETYDYVAGVRPNGDYTDDAGLYVWGGGADFWYDDDWDSYSGAATTSWSPSPGDSAPDIEFKITGFSLLNNNSKVIDFNFRVHNGSFGDNIGEDFAVGSVPEPRVLGLLATLSLMGAFRRRRRVATEGT